MEKGRKAAIKKLVADLHEKGKAEGGPKANTGNPDKAAKGFGGPKKSGAFQRPKV